MELIRYPSKTRWPQLLQRPALDLTALETTVKNILSEVKTGGDQAVRAYTRQFDGASVATLQVSAGEIAAAEQQLAGPLKAAMQQAAANIERFHAAQITGVEKIETMPGVWCWRKAVPIEKVGLYIPGGSAPLFSTVLMLGIPARLAGCKEVVLCSPPSPEGELHPAIRYAAQLTGITKVFKVGGVQAIGAMAYGTESIPKTDKIFGPGNQYVTCAKQCIAEQGVAIDMPAGPSEVAVWADESCVPEYVAADLLSQAEHGKDSQVLLFTTSEAILAPIQTALDQQLAQLPRRAIAAQALNNSRIFLLQTVAETLDMINAYAPEHLILACKNPTEIADKINNAGSVFLGHYSPESAGDYASGTNHTLPTNGYARTYSGVSVDSFVKNITFQQLSREGLQHIAATIEQMAEAEGLAAHKNAVAIRKK